MVQAYHKATEFLKAAEFGARVVAGELRVSELMQYR